MLKFRSAENIVYRYKNIIQALKLRPYVEQYVFNGGLPGTCFARDPSLRKAKIKDQLATIIDRDLRLIYETKVPFIQIIDYLRLLAINEGQPLNYSKFQRSCGLREEVQKNLLYALEAVFVLRQIPIEGRRSQPLIYFEDQAEMAYLSDSSFSQSQKMEGLIYRNVRAQFSYSLGQNIRYFQYLTRGKARIPFAVQSQEGVWNAAHRRRTAQ